jgi:hypothetical protein
MEAGDLIFCYATQVLSAESFESGELFSIQGDDVSSRRLFAEKIVKTFQQFVWVALKGCTGKQIMLSQRGGNGNNRSA